MHAPVLWLGGWASGLACWRRELETLYPGRTHAFLDAHDVLAHPALLPRAIAELPPEGTLAAWSLGSLLLHAALVSGSLRPACRVISFSPIFDFCGENGSWPPAALARMVRRLPKARESVLADFWTSLKSNSPVTGDFEAAWKRQSLGYSLDSLVLGLETLAEIRVPETLPFAGVTFVTSRIDPIAPTPRGSAEGPQWILYPKGHLPFFDYPGLVEPLLSARLRADAA
jgi:hypothetical protein